MISNEHFHAVLLDVFVQGIGSCGVFECVRVASTPAVGDIDAERRGMRAEMGDGARRLWVNGMTQ